MTGLLERETYSFADDGDSENDGDDADADDGGDDGNDNNDGSNSHRLSIYFVLILLSESPLCRCAPSM